MPLVVSCLRLLSHQNYGTEIVMMFSFLLCLLLLLRAASSRVFSRSNQNNVFVLTLISKQGMIPVVGVTPVVDEWLWAQSPNGESVRWNGQRAAPAGPPGCGMACCGR